MTRYDGSELLRERTIPQTQRMVLRLIVLIAIIVGLCAVFRVADTLLLQPMRTEDAIRSNIGRDVAYELPRLSCYAALDNGGIYGAEEEFDHYLIAIPGGDNEQGNLDVMKIPSDIAYETAEQMLATGISNLPKDEAAKLLKGSYRLTVDRGSGLSMRLRYADFASGSYEAAIEDALASQGFEEIQYSESGVDSSGNTFQAGTFARDGETFSWRVSVIALDEVYDIGAPKDSFYVGIRIERAED